jgi:hypothetical protein
MPGRTGSCRYKIHAGASGNATVLGAQARIVASTPFASTNDISYLGDLGPGQSAVASFSLNVAQGATIKMYGLDSEIRYRDQLDTNYISDIMKVPVDVKMPTGITGIITNPVDLTIIVACIIGAVYVAYHFRRKR